MQSFWSTLSTQDLPPSWNLRVIFLYILSLLILFSDCFGVLQYHQSRKRNVGQRVPRSWTNDFSFCWVSVKNYYVFLFFLSFFLYCIVNTITIILLLTRYIKNTLTINTISCSGETKAILEAIAQNRSIRHLTTYVGYLFFPSAPSPLLIVL